MDGLLQTAEYAALVIGDDPRRPSEVVDRRVRFRMERQRSVLGARRNVTFTFIMAETALRFGPPEITKQQVDHLRAAANSKVDVRVLPFSAGSYPRRGNFTLLDFADAEDPSVVYLELPMGARYFDRLADVQDYEFVFDLIAEKAVPIKEWKS